MSEITLKIYREGGVVCQEKNCWYMNECANHYTAGDYRREGGFTPDIVRQDDKFFCNTKDSPRELMPASVGSLSFSEILPKDKPNQFTYYQLHQILSRMSSEQLNQKVSIRTNTQGETALVFDGDQFLANFDNETSEIVVNLDNKVSS